MIAVFYEVVCILKFKEDCWIVATDSCVHNTHLLQSFDRDNDSILSSNLVGCGENALHPDSILPH